MFDMGTLIPAVAAVLSAIGGAWATYKTMSNKDATDLDSEQKQWRDEMRKEATELRERMNIMQAMIDTLLTEKYQMQKDMATMAVTIEKLRGNVHDITGID